MEEAGTGGYADVLACDVGRLGADLATVDALARLQLLARRRGCHLELLGASRELRDLLELAGLAHVVPVSGGSALGVGGQAEQGEQLGVEERGDARDPSP